MTRETIRDDDGKPLIAVCADQPLTDEARGHFAELARTVRKTMAEEDPDGLRGDSQRRRIDRLWKRETPACGKPGCERIEDHDGRCTPDLPKETP